MTTRDFGFFTADPDAANDSMYEPDPSGGYKLRGVKRASEMSRSEKVQFIDKHGNEAWDRLVAETYGPARGGGRSAMSTADKAKYIQEHGVDEFLALPD